jgi:hypothetical protein
MLLLGARVYRLGPAGLGSNPHGLPLKSFILFVSGQHVPDAFGRFLGDHGPGHLPAASALNLAVLFLDHVVMGIGGDGRLPKSDAQVPVPIFIYFRIYASGCPRCPWPRARAGSSW